jgi:hypothetical protein
MCFRIHFGTTDIFEYFAALGRLNKLPSFEDLEKAAKKLFDTYVASGARYQAGVDARDEATKWTARAPLGTPWVPMSTSSSKPSKPKNKSKKPTSTKIPQKKPKAAPKAAPKAVPELPPFFGDQALFDSGSFMYDAMVFREGAAATAQGDVGRVWETMKVILRSQKNTSGAQLNLGHGLQFCRLNALEVHELSPRDDLRHRA